MRARALSVALLTAGLVTGPARAEPPSSAEPRAEWRSRPRVLSGDDGVGASAAADALRPLAAAPPAEGSEAAAAARALLTPLRLGFEAVSLPIRGALYLLGRFDLPERVVELLYNDDHTAAILPVFSFLSSQGASIGARAFHAGLGRHDERVGIEARFGGRFVQAYEVEVSAPRVAGTPLGLAVSARYEIEPHLRFWGYGPGASAPEPLDAPTAPRAQHTESQYRQDRARVRGRVAWAFDAVGDLALLTTFNHRSFGPRALAGDSVPSIEQVYDTAKLAGFDSGVDLIEPLLDCVVDSRRPRGTTSRGVYFNGFIGGAPPQGGLQFLHYGAELAGYIDLFRGDRVLALHLAHESVLGDEVRIPMSDMPRLGGPRSLRGYELDRFRDKHTLLVTAQYHWPVHEYVAALAFLELGSVGRDYQELFDPASYAPSIGAGLELRSLNTKLFSVQVAYGDGVQLFLTTDALVSLSKRGGEAL